MSREGKKKEDIWGENEVESAGKARRKKTFGKKMKLNEPERPEGRRHLWKKEVK